MSRILIILTVFVFFGLSSEVLAQDPQYSQYYAAPLNLNPGLTGINQKGRVGLNYRNQWPSIDASFESYSFYVDYNWVDYYSSLGLIVNTDREGIAGLRSTMIGLQYAYQLQLNYNWTFRPAVQLAYYQRDINFDRLTFGDQFDATGQAVHRVFKFPCDKLIFQTLCGHHHGAGAAVKITHHIFTALMHKVVKRRNDFCDALGGVIGKHGVK